MHDARITIARENLKQGSRFDLTVDSIWNYEKLAIYTIRSEVDLEWLPAPRMPLAASVCRSSWRLATGNIRLRLRLAYFVATNSTLPVRFRLLVSWHRTSCRSNDKIDNSKDCNQPNNSDQKYEKKY